MLIARNGCQAVSRRGPICAPSPLTAVAAACAGGSRLSADSLTSPRTPSTSFTSFTSSSITRFMSTTPNAPLPQTTSAARQPSGSHPISSSRPPDETGPTDTAAPLPSFSSSSTSSPRPTHPSTVLANVSAIPDEDLTPSVLAIVVRKLAKDARKMSRDSSRGDERKAMDEAGSHASSSTSSRSPSAMEEYQADARWIRVINRVCMQAGEAASDTLPAIAEVDAAAPIPPSPTTPSHTLTPSAWLSLLLDLDALTRGNATHSEAIDAATTQLAKRFGPVAVSDIRGIAACLRSAAAGQSRGEGGRRRRGDESDSITNTTRPLVIWAVSCLGESLSLGSLISKPRMQQGRNTSPSAPSETAELVLPSLRSAIRSLISIGYTFDTGKRGSQRGSQSLPLSAFAGTLRVCTAAVSSSERFPAAAISTSTASASARDHWRQDFDALAAAFSIVAEMQQHMVPFGSLSNEGPEVRALLNELATALVRRNGKATSVSSSSSPSSPSPASPPGSTPSLGLGAEAWAHISLAMMSRGALDSSSAASLSTSVNSCSSRSWSPSAVSKFAEALAHMSFAAPALLLRIVFKQAYRLLLDGSVSASGRLFSPQGISALCSCMVVCDARDEKLLLALASHIAGLNSSGGEARMTATTAAATVEAAGSQQQQQQQLTKKVSIRAEGISDFSPSHVAELLRALAHAGVSQPRLVSRIVKEVPPSFFHPHVHRNTRVEDAAAGSADGEGASKREVASSSSSSSSTAGPGGGGSSGNGLRPLTRLLWAFACNDMIRQHPQYVDALISQFPAEEKGSSSSGNLSSSSSPPITLPLTPDLAPLLHVVSIAVDAYRAEETKKQLQKGGNGMAAAAAAATVRSLPTNIKGAAAALAMAAAEQVSWPAPAAANENFILDVAAATSGGGGGLGAGSSAAIKQRLYALGFSQRIQVEVLASVLRVAKSLGLVEKPQLFRKDEKTGALLHAFLPSSSRSSSSSSSSTGGAAVLILGPKAYLPKDISTLPPHAATAGHAGSSDLLRPQTFARIHALQHLPRPSLDLVFVRPTLPQEIGSAMGGDIFGRRNARSVLDEWIRTQLGATTAFKEVVAASRKRASSPEKP